MKIEKLKDFAILAVDCNKPHAADAQSTVRCMGLLRNKINELVDAVNGKEPQQELLPCPWCSTVDNLIFEEWPNSIICEKCEVIVVTGVTKQEAIDAWNSRA